MPYLVGSVVVLAVDVTDTDDVLTTPSALTLVVTKPDATTSSPTITELSTGKYEALYTTTMAGRHVAVWTATTPTGKYAETFEVAAVTTTAVVTLAQAADYLGTTSATDPQIQDALTAEAAAQAAACRVPAAYPAPLAEALKRRVARNLALRAIPLAVLQGDADSGSMVLPGRDPEVRRLEAPYRRLVVG